MNAERLRELLHYEPTTGRFTWLVSPTSTVPVGIEAGYLNANGYVVIGVEGRAYMAHRLAVLYVTGAMPTAEVDHRNGVRNCNVYTNLREVSHAENMQNERRARRNSKTGLLGVYLCKRTKRFTAQLSVNGRTKRIGRFDTPEAAHAAYLDAKRRLHEGNTL